MRGRVPLVKPAKITSKRGSVKTSATGNSNGTSQKSGCSIKSYPTCVDCGANIGDSKPDSAVTAKLDDMNMRFESLVDRLQAIEVRLDTKVDQSQSKAEGRDLQILEEVQQRLEHKVDQLGTNMDEPVALAVQDALQQDKAEELEIEKRKTNVIIIHGLAESQDDSSDHRISDDLAVLSVMFHEAGVERVQKLKTWSDLVEELLTLFRTRGL